MTSTFYSTPEQQAVIDHDSGHALVSAVAGAGKTTTMVERMTKLVSAGVNPSRIMAITFNKSAQINLQTKLKERLPGINPPQARTFHSIGNGMLTVLVNAGALKPAKLEKSTGVQEQKMRTALRTAWKRTYGANAFPTKEQADSFYQFVTLVKSDIKPAQEIFRQGQFLMECLPFVNAFAEFENESHKANIFFYDDQLYRTYQALDADPELWSLFSDRVEHLLVDEFQDTNNIQFALLKGIAGSRANVMAIGDADQSIYGFRGASVDIINSQFAKEFSPCTFFRLSNTFRYGHQTALLANHIISLNIERDDKITVAAPGNPDTRVTRVPAFPKKPSGIIPLVTNAFQEKELLTHAMLVRYYSQSIPYEIELAEARIPFHVYGREPLLLIPEIASLVAAMSLATDYWVIPEMLRARFLSALLKSPTVFAKAELVEIATKMMDEAVSKGLTASSALFELINKTSDKSSITDRFRQRADVIRMLEAGGLSQQPPTKIIAAYLALTDFQATVKSASGTQSQAMEIEQNVSAFSELASRYPTTTELLDTLGPLAGHRADEPPSHDHLPIMSIHRAKGQEWDTVYLPGWSAGTFPREHEPQEEERRLAYVAVTRAINHLVFLHPQDQVLNDLEKNLDMLPPKGSPVALSPFMYEAETGLCAKAADAIRDGRYSVIQTRRDTIVNRYMHEADIDLVIAQVPPEIANHFKQTSSNPKLVLEVGQRICTTGTPALHYTVSSKVGDRFYYVKPESHHEDMRLMCLDEPGWVLA